MKLITNHELHQRSESELSALFCTVSKGLVRTRRGSPERRNALRLAGKYQPGTGRPHDRMPAVKREPGASAPPVSGVAVWSAILAVLFLFALPLFQLVLLLAGLFQLFGIDFLGVFRPLPT
jgi:hypothetical protein